MTPGHLSGYPMKVKLNRIDWPHEYVSPPTRGGRRPNSPCRVTHGRGRLRYIVVPDQKWDYYIVDK
jgi:hypothetical protein